MSGKIRIKYNQDGNVFSVKAGRFWFEFNSISESMAGYCDYNKIRAAEITRPLRSLLREKI